MSRVYLLMKHPPHPYRTSAYLSAGECIGVYTGKSVPERIAVEKNERAPHYLYTVQSKQLKESQ